MKNISSGKSKSITSQGKYPFFGSTGIISYSNKSDYSGDKILIARVGANAGFIYKVEGSYAVSDNALILDLKNEKSLDFIFYYLLKYNLNKLIFGSGQPLITGGQLKSIEIKLPLIEEQKKISSFLFLIDTRIQTQRKIIEKLETLMKGNREKIFSQKLRFKDEKGNYFPDWKDMVLGNIGEVKMCKRVFNDQTSANGDIPFYKIGSFGKIADAFISKQLYKDYRKRFPFPKKGDILISAAGTIGRTVVYRGEDAYYQDSNIVWIDNDNVKVLNEFLYYILQIVQYSTEGGTIQRLYNNILKSTKFRCPSISEQTKIAIFLSSIQEKIETEKQILEKLELQKKFLLSNLFV